MDPAGWKYVGKTGEAKGAGGAAGAIYDWSRGCSDGSMKGAKAPIGKMVPKSSLRRWPKLTHRSPIKFHSLMCQPVQLPEAWN